MAGSIGNWQYWQARMLHAVNAILPNWKWALKRRLSFAIVSICFGAGKDVGKCESRRGLRSYADVAGTMRQDWGEMTHILGLLSSIQGAKGYESPGRHIPDRVGWCEPTRTSQWQWQPHRGYSRPTSQPTRGLRRVVQEWKMQTDEGTVLRHIGPPDITIDQHTHAQCTSICICNVQ